MEFSEIIISELEDIYPIVNLYRDLIPLALDDLIVSVVFVDITRYPVALMSKFRSDNFDGFESEYYNSLKNNLQYISDESLINQLITDKTFITIEDVDDLKIDPVGDVNERKFMLENNWKSAFFHTLFVENIEFGYLSLFTEKNKLTEDQIKILTEFLSHTLPILSEKLVILSYLWKSHIYKQDVIELEENLSDLVIAITRKGEIVRVNSRSNYYFGKPPKELLGKDLKLINPELYKAILSSINLKKSQGSTEISLQTSYQQSVTLELVTWETGIASDRTIICFANDITLIKTVVKEIQEQN